MVGSAILPLPNPGRCKGLKDLLELGGEAHISTLRSPLYPLYHGAATLLGVSLEGSTYFRKLKLVFTAPNPILEVLVMNLEISRLHIFASVFCVQILALQKKKKNHACPFEANTYL